MLLTAAQRRFSMIGGAFGLAAIVLFIALAVFMLLMASGIQSLASVLADPYIGRVLRFTLLQAFLSTLLSVVFAIPLAQALARQPDLPGRQWIVRLMALPMGLPVLVGALGLIGIWGRQGALNSLLLRLGLAEPISIYGLAGILLAHVFFNLPLACRLMLMSLERIPGEYWLVGAGLGMRPKDIFRFVEWPVLRSVIPGVAGLIFMLCATSFTLVLALGGGPAATTIEVAIYQSLRFDFDPGRAVSLSVLQIVLTAIILGGMALLRSVDDEGTTVGKTVKRPDGTSLPVRLLDITLLFIGVAFLLLPLISIAVAGLRANLIKLVLEPIFWRSTITSALIATCSAVLSSSIAMLLVRARHTVALGGSRSLADRAFFGAMGSASSFVMLVPPIVLATGWFMALRSVGDINAYAPILIAAINALMSLPFVMRVLEPAYATHQQRTQRLSASLGIEGFSRLRFVDWPAMRQPLLTALSFAAALSLGDLGAVALFGSDSLVTLPWLIYSRIGSYRTSDADGLALILGIICLLLTIAGTRGNTRKEAVLHG
ncbi:thiamine/thiamine pyrophosphate ABC transporter permease ThiP [Rhizobium grahamii]|uniref:Thiamine transport system permease protein ThiP n=1 Tax=Rhizobium grahamii TaxID=1120045 RepID=A0A5Q0CEU9_9HYPH|nr:MULTISPECIES: thiamine/thiamine pyrophosphate ABC transporter permease ThiP [Rhizobium]QFY62481.1 thiamine/thiamine pyrophosphate ABC transporter permease ThiP [Rhizobium grahamii]QRM51328.1 thiamine/thiamine pyrophosphate ABC transporter permease ThiP [Rhizobium sp. BG6]